MVGKSFTFPTALPLKGNVKLLGEQGRATSLQLSPYHFFCLAFWGDSTSLGKMKDTKISLISGICKHSDLLKVCFAGYHLTNTELEPGQACDVKHILKLNLSVVFLLK